VNNFDFKLFCLQATFQRLGLRHAELTLPLVSQLLEIHPFFDTAEPDIEDPAYLCILVLVRLTTTF
jgi:hypothetical protein